MTQGLVVAFLVGGLICVLAQLIIELTPYSITPAHILVGYVVGGAVLSGLGWYQPLVDLAGARCHSALIRLRPYAGAGCHRSSGAGGLKGRFYRGLTASGLRHYRSAVMGFMVAMVFNPKG